MGESRMVDKKVKSSAPCINFIKGKQLPAVGKPNTVYYVKGNGDTVVKSYITDINGNPTLISGTEVQVNTFINLLDTPNSYAGQGGKVVRVKEDATGLEFITISSTPYSFIPVTIQSGVQEVVLTWSTVANKHGLKPIYIDLYEVLGENVQVQSTARAYTEDGGLTYRWFVSATSNRNWEIRIYGYVPGGTPPFDPVWNDVLVWDDNNIWQE